MSQTPIQSGTFDYATLAGVIIAVLSVLGGLLLEGGSVRDVAQGTAALMVFGGTLAAVLVSTPLSILLGAMRGLPKIIYGHQPPISELLDRILALTVQARRAGIASLEDSLGEIEDPFLAKAVELAADGSPLTIIRSTMELQIDLEEKHLHAEARVFEAAGGYAPTIGIIGAVLGLIQVMKHLENIDEVGRGIAVSFVATVYGVALANLVLLPAAAKLKARAERLSEYHECALEGVAGIVELLNPTLLRQRLEPYHAEPNLPRRVKPAAAPVARSAAA